MVAVEPHYAFVILERRYSREKLVGGAGKRIWYVVVAGRVMPAELRFVLRAELNGIYTAELCGRKGLLERKAAIDSTYATILIFIAEHLVASIPCFSRIKTETS